MNAFFSTSERVQALERSAAIWPGTPFCHHGAVPGKSGGASCHCLANAVLKGAGFDLAEELPRVRVTWGRQHTGGLMLPYFRARGIKFAEITPVSIDAILPGDVLVANIGELCEHHCGVALTGQKLIHTLRATGAHFTAFGDPFLKASLVAIFRPLE